jgi:ribosomal protein L27
VTASYAGNEILGASSSQAITFQVLKATSTTTLTLSTAKVTFGHEQTERLSVKVSPRWAGTPGGVVTIKHGTTVLCKITLSSGKGSCTLSAKALAVGADRRLFATYAGNGNFTGSSSAAKDLAVVG